MICFVANLIQVLRQGILKKPDKRGCSSGTIFAYNTSIPYKLRHKTACFLDNFLDMISENPSVYAVFSMFVLLYHIPLFFEQFLLLSNSFPPISYYTGVSMWKIGIIILNNYSVSFFIKAFCAYICSSAAFITSSRLSPFP